MIPRLKESWPHSPAELALLVRVFWMLHRFRGHTPSDGLKPFLERLTPAMRVAEPDDARMRKVVLYVDAICSRISYLRSDACVPRSLTLYHFARRFGHDAVWNCGVRKTSDGALDGHAWLTRNGAPYLEPDDRARRFTVTFSYPPDRVTPSGQGPHSKSTS